MGFTDKASVYQLASSFTRFYSLNNCDHLKSSDAVIETISTEVANLQKSLFAAFKSGIAESKAKLKQSIRHLKRKFENEYNKLNLNSECEAKSFRPLRISESSDGIGRSDTFESDQNQEFIELSSSSGHSKEREFPEPHPLSNFIEIKDFEFTVRECFKLNEDHLGFLRTKVLGDQNTRFKLVFSKDEPSIPFADLETFSKNKSLLFLFLSNEKRKFGVKLNQVSNDSGDKILFQVQNEAMYLLEPNKKNIFFRFDKKNDRLIFGNKDLVIKENCFEPKSCRYRAGKVFDIDPSKRLDDKSSSTVKFHLESMLVYELIEI